MIVVRDDLSLIQFTMENRTGGAHPTGLTMSGLPEGQYTIAVDGRQAAAIQGSASPQRIQLSLGPAASARVIITRKGNETKRGAE